MEAKSLQGDQISAYHLTAASARGDPNNVYLEGSFNGGTQQLRVPQF